MMTLDAVRAAALAADPYTEMDQLVRAELSAGRSVRQITKDYLPILDVVLETPELTEDGEEALRGTLDALLGDCHPDCQYKDPLNGTLPTEEEIAELPRWAQVALAARCARRVLPIFSGAPDAPVHAYTEAVRTAIELSELVGAGFVLSPDDSLMELVDSLQGFSGDYLRSSVVSAAKVAAVAAAGNRRGVALAAKFSTGAFPDADFRTTIRRDFDHLARLAEAQRWDDDTPVPPEVFGPLWPEGAPKGWPAAGDVPQRAELVIEAFARERATERMIEDDLVNLFNALNRYHIARSGVRLTLDQFRSLLPALAAVEV